MELNQELERLTRLDEYKNLQNSSKATIKEMVDLIAKYEPSEDNSDARRYYSLYVSLGEEARRFVDINLASEFVAHEEVENIKAEFSDRIRTFLVTEEIAMYAIGQPHLMEKFTRNVPATTGAATRLSTAVQ